MKKFSALAFVALTLGILPFLAQTSRVRTPGLDLTNPTGPLAFLSTLQGACTPPGTVGSDVLCVGDSSHEIVAAMNGSVNLGMLVRVQPSPVTQTTKTAAIATATLCAAANGACNVAGQYRVHWNFWGSGTACADVTAGSVTFLLTWTDENSVVHSAVALQMTAQSGAATAATQSSFPFQTALANESAGGDLTISSNGSVIQYATGYTACTTGTGTYNLRASVARLQ